MAAPVPYFTLNNGQKIPSVGLGCWLGQPGGVDTNGRDVRQALKDAINEAGYRHVDTAALYQDEAEVGEAVRASSVPREEIFITTKLGSGSRDSAESVQAAFDDSFKKLDLGYIDAVSGRIPSPQRLAKPSPLLITDILVH